MEYIQTKRGQKALIFGGRSFSLHMTYKNGNKRWLCRSKLCKGSLIISAEEKVIRKDQGHSCTPDYAKIAVEKMKDRGLKRCREELTPISVIHKEIFSSALDQGLDSLVKVPNLSSIKSSMYRNRNKALEDSFVEGDYSTFDSKEDTETKDEVSMAPVECILEEKKELSLEERYFPSPPTVSFEGLDSALPDESICFDDLLQDASEASDMEAKKGESSAEEDFEFSDEDKKAENELVSLGYGLEVKAKFLNKCLIFGKTAKKLTRCLIDVIFPDAKLLANCSAFGSKSNLTKLTRAALPSRKVACIIDYVKKRFPDASKSEIVMAINLKCKEARAIIEKSSTEGKKPVVRRLLAKEQEQEAVSEYLKAGNSLLVSKVKLPSHPKVKLPPVPKVQKPTTTENTTGSDTVVTTTASTTVLRPNIVCVGNPSKASVPPQLKQKFAPPARPNLVQLRLPPPRTAAPSIISKTVLKLPPKARPEAIQSFLTRARPGGSNILLPVQFLNPNGQQLLKKTDAAGSQRPCIIMGTRTTEVTPRTVSTNSQEPCTSTSKKE